MLIKNFPKKILTGTKNINNILLLAHYRARSINFYNDIDDIGEKLDKLVWVEEVSSCTERHSDFGYIMQTTNVNISWTYGIRMELMYVFGRSIVEFVPIRGNENDALYVLNGTIIGNTDHVIQYSMKFKIKGRYLADTTCKYRIDNSTDWTTASDFTLDTFPISIGRVWSRVIL